MEDIFGDKSDKFLLKVIESMPIGILVFNSDGRIVYLNDNFLEFCAYHKIEIHPSNTINIFEEDLFTEIPLKENLQKVKEGFPFEKIIDEPKSFRLHKIIVTIKIIPILKEDSFVGGIIILQDTKAGEIEKDKLKNIERYWKEILTYSFDLFLITDEACKLISYFGKKLKRFTWRISPFEHPSINSLFSKEENTKLNEYISSVRKGKCSQKFILTLLVNNRPIDYECEIEPVLDENNNIKLLFFRFSDISDYIKTQKILENKIQELQTQKNYIDEISIPLFIIDLNGNITYWNKSSQDLFGFSEFHATGKNFIRLIGIREADFFENLKKDLLVSKKVQRTVKLLGLEGKEETINLSFSLAETENPNVFVSCQNISDKIDLEHELKNAERKFNDLVQKSNSIIFSVDSKGFFLFANQAFIDLAKISIDDLSNFNLIDLLKPQIRKSDELEILYSESKKQNVIDLQITFRDGRILYLSGYLDKSIDSSGNITFTGYFQNTTTIKEFDKQHRLLNSLLATAKAGIAIEAKGKLTITNAAFVQLFGYHNLEELRNKSFVELVDEADIKRISEYLHLIRRNLDAPDTFEFLGKNSDGSRTYFSVSVSRFEIDSDTYLVYFLQDISERKRAQKALQDSEEKYRSLIENIDDFFYIYSLMKDKLRPTFYTKNVIKITGYSDEEFIKDNKLFFRIILPDDFHQVKNELKSLIRNKTKSTAELEFRIISRNGNIVWVRNKINLVKSEEGVIKKLFGIVSDITSQKKAEEQFTKSREDLIKLNETKDRFLSIVSHDLRTPFSSILGFTDLLLNDETLTEQEKRNYINYIRESSNYMLSLINSLLDWNRLQTGRIKFEPNKIKIKTLVNKCINSLSGAALKKNISIESLLPIDLQVFADENLITQVFNNLISNAIKFTNPGGNISISVRPSEISRYLEFSVKDDGIGMKPEEIKKLFSIETKLSKDGTANEKGSGLGLTIVQDIIKKHGGTIWAESEFGKGSTFKFTLPIASDIILLVDDSITERLLYSKILRNLVSDYKIKVAANGKEALLKILESVPALVITDHLMPEMNGLELVHEIQKLDPKLIPPIIILTGEIDKAIVSDYKSLGINYIFKKPVNLTDFQQAIEKVIGEGLLGKQI